MLTPSKSQRPPSFERCRLQGKFVGPAKEGRPECPLCALASLHSLLLLFTTFAVDRHVHLRDFCTSENDLALEKLTSAQIRHTAGRVILLRVHLITNSSAIHCVRHIFRRVLENAWRVGKAGAS